MRKIFYLCIFLTAPFILVFEGCGGIPKDALRMNETTLEDRQMQTRVFDTNDEAEILSASSSLLQDLGFNLDESETDLGLIVSSKDRDAKEAGQVIGAIAWTAMFGILGDARYDTKQKIRASIVTSAVGETGERTAVRVTFQKIVWDQKGKISKLERLNDPKMYQEFFDKLSKAIFLEAHDI